MRKLSQISIAGFVVILFLAASTGSGNAAIKCKGMYQVIKGHGLVSTPYCQDQWLAGYARSRGMKVTFKQIKNNPGVKAEVCQFLRHDFRVQSVCGSLADDDSGPMFRRF
ncbi:MAG: hypothetical protein ACR2OW_05310 [Methyloligellaceae bacterium]